MKIFILEYISSISDFNDLSNYETDLYPRAYDSLNDALNCVIESCYSPGKIIISCVYPGWIPHVKPVARMARYRGV